MLKNITPVILTLNEKPNIARSLAKLSWASDIVVVDSFSSDGTAEYLRSVLNVRLYERRFDSHASQWNFAVTQTEIRTDWILALDADYVLTDQLMRELENLSPEKRIAGYRVPFTYCVGGQPLWGSLYPPGLVLFRKGLGKFRQDGHTQRLELEGDTARLVGRIRHDDRKPLSAWLAAQGRYASLEAASIKKTPFRRLSPINKLRRLIVVAPMVCFLYCFFLKGACLQGRAGAIYVFQRVMAEMIIAVELLGNDSTS